MKDKIMHVVSFDFDGCLLPARLNGSVCEHNEKLLACIKKQNDYDFTSCLLFTGSNRQSQSLDLANALHNGGDASRLSFPVLKTIAEQGSTKARLYPVLLADVYNERPDGYSFMKAMTHINDTTAYHYSTLFDEFKSTILYFQTHTAAKLMRGCDFLMCANIDDLESLAQLPFASNAAYIYIESQGKLYYVNRAEEMSNELPIRDLELLQAFLAEKNDQLMFEEHDYVVPFRDGAVKGFHLDETRQDQLTAITGHRHVAKDYRIIFDYFDDRDDIFVDMVNTFRKKNDIMFPGNVTIRLHPYNAAQPTNIRLPFASIQGSGSIDLNPKLTLQLIAKQLLQKDEITDEDYLVQRENAFFSSFFSKDARSSDIFKNRNVVKPTVSHQKDDLTYASLTWYHSCFEPELVKKLSGLIVKLEKEKRREGYFNPVPYFSDYPHRPRVEYNTKAIKIRALIDILIQSQSKTIEEMQRFFDPAILAPEVTEGRFSSRTKDLLEELRPRPGV